MAKPYEYKGELFQVEESGGCELKVSDKANTISITPNAGGSSTYRVSTVKGGWWWHTNSVKESVDRACKELIDSRTAPTPEQACKALGDFVETL